MKPGYGFAKVASHKLRVTLLEAVALNGILEELDRNFARLNAGIIAETA
jgi:hypothetical protein